MQVDVAQIKQMTDEECQLLIKEGRCFFCKKQGHVSRNCPDCPKQARPTRARVIETVKQEEAPKETPTVKKDLDYAKILMEMNEEQRGKLLDDLISMDSSF
jgi:hypothetical protein